MFFSQLFDPLCYYAAFIYEKLAWIPLSFYHVFEGWSIIGQFAFKWLLFITYFLVLQYLIRLMNLLKQWRHSDIVQDGMLAVHHLLLFCAVHNIY